MGKLVQNLSGLLLLTLCVSAGRPNGPINPSNRFPAFKNINYQFVPAAQDVAPVVVPAAPAAPTTTPGSAGYTYVPPVVNTGLNHSQNLGSLTQLAAEQIARLAELSQQPSNDHHMAILKNVQVQCGKERMMVVATFDRAFNGVIYAKGHYSDEECVYVKPNSGQAQYTFIMKTGTCGVEFIDDGLKAGGQAFVQAMMVVLYEPGVQEAWDLARQIRCLWEGNIDQTVSFPFNVNMLDLETLDFNGDTASASLEVQMGQGPNARAVQGAVRIGDVLTAVVKVTGDPDFDLLVRDCVAMDGTSKNNLVLTDAQGCAQKTKLMGGWKKEKVGGNVYAYAQLSAFKFPDVMQMYLQCAVSLCKGECQQCPQYKELDDPAHHHHHEEGEAGKPETTSGSIIDPRGGSNRRRRHAHQVNQTQESVLLRRPITVLGPDDFPELYTTVVNQQASQKQGEQQQATNTTAECFSMMTIMATAFAVVFLVLTAIMITIILKQGSSSSNNKDFGRTDTKKYLSTGFRH